MAKEYFPYNLTNNNTFTEDQQNIDQWLTGNAVIGSVFTVGLIVMALAGFYSPPPSDTMTAARMKAPSAIATFAGS
jgi:hypothetical protein